MPSVYEKCPIYENEKYLFRLVEKQDWENLLKVYSDVNALPFFNRDNCNGDNFHYTSAEQMKMAMIFGFWNIVRNIMFVGRSSIKQRMQQ